MGDKMYNMHKIIKRRKRIKNILIIILIIIFIISMIMFYKNYTKTSVMQYNNSYNVEKTSITLEDAKEKNKTVSEILEKNMPNVVGISKIKSNGITALGVEKTRELGIGSGVIISKKGYILTNQHVSGEMYATCYVTLENGENLTATVVWSDSKLDLSIIKVEHNLSGCGILGNSEDIKIGESVYAIGNPIGMEFQRTVTSGIISATNRSITFQEGEEQVYMDNLIQTDATINPGNSGGPLLNIYGEIIGINTVKITSAEGIGFAVPINIIKPILQKLEDTGKFEEATIGIICYDKTVAQYLYLSEEVKNGIFVIGTGLDSGVDTSQILYGDIVAKIDNVSVNKMIDLRTYVYSKSPGDKVILTVIRNNRNIEIPIKLGRKI